MTNIDHIVIAAKTLEEGVAYIQDKLGVDIPKGGQHPAMATHNHLMQLGNDTFLEVMAINTEMETPDRPRWFGLDDPYIRLALENGPRLHTWVANTVDMAAIQSQSKIALGEVIPLSRGDLRWQFSIPDDGRVLAGGLAPYMMQWEGQGEASFKHPSQGMTDLGCKLVGLELHHPRVEWLTTILASINATDLVTVHQLDSNAIPFMQAIIQTPTGEKQLSSSL